MSNGMPRVWLTDARIGNTWWEANGIEVWFHATLNIEHCSSQTLIGKVWGLDTPTVTVLQPSSGEMDSIPDSMGQVQNWIDEVDLLEHWKQEVATYKEVMSQVDMGGLKPCAGERSLYWTLLLTAPGAAPLELGVTVAAGWAKALLQAADDREVYYTLCTYELELPITLIDLKTRVRETLMDYMPS